MEKDEGMKDFRVRCTETLALDVVVRAKNAKEAESIADDAWSDGLIEIDWDNVDTCTCKAIDDGKIGRFGNDYYCYRRKADGNGVEEF